MQTFKNTRYTTRNYENTNVIICEADQAPADYWMPCNESEKNGLTKLFIEWANSTQVTYYGYL